MKSLYFRLLSLLAAFAGLATLAATSSTCCLVLYEPEMPEELSRE